MDAPPATRAPRVGAVEVLTVLAVTAMGLVRVSDDDIWWHVRTGRWIWEHHAIPTTDLFSHTQGGPLLYTEALAQLVFYGAYAALEVPGLGLASMAILGGLAWVVLDLARHGTGSLRRGVDPVASRAPAVLALALFAGAAEFRFGPKTDMFTFVGFGALLALLARASPRGSEGGNVRALWAAVGLLLVWANLHRGGTIALPVLALFAAAWAVRGHRRQAVTALAVLALGAGALCVSPGGVRYITSAFDLSARASFRAALPEWGPMHLWLFADAPLLGVVIGLWLWDWAARRSLDAMTLTALGALALAVWSVRFVPLAAVAMVPGVTSALDRSARWLAAHLETPIRPSVRAALGGTAAVGVVALSYGLAVPASEAGLGLAWWTLPVDCAEFLRAHPPPGRMYNSFDLGGYLLFALGPEQKVFIDGRNDTVYPAPFFAQYARADTDPALLFDLLARYQVTYAVVACSTLPCRDLPSLQANPEWIPVYLDDVATVLVREAPETHDYIAAHGYATLRAYDSVPRVMNLRPDAAAGPLERDVLRNAAEAPRSARAQWLAAVVLRLRGRTAEYQAARAAYVTLAAERGLELPAP